MYNMISILHVMVDLFMTQIEIFHMTNLIFSTDQCVKKVPFNTHRKERRGIKFHFFLSLSRSQKTLNRRKKNKDTSTVFVSNCQSNVTWTR